jgi:hypothetical protein
MTVVLAAFAFLRWYTPGDLIVCGFRWLTGLLCPLCGMTRALRALVQGDLAAAWSLHPLSIPALLLLAGIGFGAALELCGYKANLPWRHGRFWSITAAVLLVFGILRIVGGTL